MGRDLTDTDFWDQRYAGGPNSPGSWRRRLGRVAEEVRGDLWRRILAIPALPQASVIELGCAPGRILERMARVAPHNAYHGLDYSAPGLEACKKALAAAGVEAELHEGDLWTTELPTKFDIVVSAGLVEHFDKPAEALRRHAAFARPGGWVVVTTPNWTRPWFNRAVVMALRPDTFATHNGAVMDPDRLGEALREAGRTDVQCGGGAGAFVTTVRQSATLSARLLQVAARVWNLTITLVPPLRGCWGSTTWAVGRVPPTQGSSDAPTPMAIEDERPCSAH